MNGRFDLTQTRLTGSAGVAGGRAPGRPARRGTVAADAQTHARRPRRSRRPITHAIAGGRDSYADVVDVGRAGRRHDSHRGQGAGVADAV